MIVMKAKKRLVCDLRVVSDVGCIWIPESECDITIFNTTPQADECITLSTPNLLKIYTC